LIYIVRIEYDTIKMEINIFEEKLENVVIPNISL